MWKVLEQLKDGDYYTVTMRDNGGEYEFKITYIKTEKGVLSLRESDFIFIKKF